MTRKLTEYAVVALAIAGVVAMAYLATEACEGDAMRATFQGCE